MLDERLRELERSAEDLGSIFRFRLECIRACDPTRAGFWPGDRVEWRKLDRHGRLEKTPWGTETAIKWVHGWGLGFVSRSFTGRRRGDVEEEWDGLYLGEMAPWDLRGGTWLLLLGRLEHLTLLEPCPVEEMEVYGNARGRTRYVAKPLRGRP